MFDDQMLALKQLTMLLLRLVIAFKWFFLSLFYLGLTFRFGLLASAFLLPPFALAVLALQKDREREREGMDDFTGDGLFFRYGELVERSVISIPVNTAWSHTETSEFAEGFREKLAARILARVPPELVQVSASIPVADLNTQERKRFLRVLVRSRFGSTITRFIHFAPFGQTITAHVFTLRRGATSDWETVKFFLECPLMIFRWGVPWILNRFSILARVSRYRESSFDAMDLQTMYSHARDISLHEMETLLEEAGLLTDEVKNAIQINLTNHQTIHASGAAQVRVGAVSQKPNLPAPARIA